MNPFRPLQIVVALFATLPMLCPAWTNLATANDFPPNNSSTPRDSVRPDPSTDSRPVDVVLGTGNLLPGRVVTSLDEPITDTELIVTQARQEVARVITNENGEFQVRLPRGGVYLLSTTRSVSVVRAWTTTAAPPTALTSVTLVERLVVRGQDEDSPPKRRHGKGLLLLGITAALAAAIALPLAVIDYKDDHEKHKSNSH